MSFVYAASNRVGLWLSSNEDLACNEDGTVVAAGDYFGQFGLWIMPTIDFVYVEHDRCLDRIHHLFTAKELVVASKVNHSCSTAGEDRVIVTC